MTILWCSTHKSKVIVSDDTVTFVDRGGNLRIRDEPDDFWLCETSNRSPGRGVCEIVEAEVTWPSP